MTASSFFDHYFSPTILPQHRFFTQIPKTAEILIPGCGTSLLGPTMYNAGWHNITQIDIAPEAVSLMASRFASLSELQTIQLDALDANIPSHAFSVCIDKALLDYLLAHGEDALKYLQEVKRLVTPGGVFIVISHGTPQRRLALFTSALQVSASSIEIATVPKPVVPSFDLGESPSFYLYRIQL